MEVVEQVLVVVVVVAAVVVMAVAVVAMEWSVQGKGEETEEEGVCC